MIKLDMIKPKTNHIIPVKIETSMIKKILILTANPLNNPRLKLEQEVREIEEGLRRATNRNRFEIYSKLAVRHRDFRQALLDYEPNIVHFTGHGQEEGLMLEDDIGFAALVSSKALSGLFELCKGHIECVILNACYSIPQAIAINKHIDYVIGMKKAIKDHASIEFSVGFYDALGAGRSIEDAFSFGRAAILAQFHDLPDSHIPTLKIRKDIKKIITRGKEDMIKIKILIETTGDIFEASVSLDAFTAAVKKHLIDLLKLPLNFENGMPISYYLLNKTRDLILEDNKTLRKNDVRENDIFVFLVENNDQ